MTLGERHNRLTATKLIKRATWLFTCDCGNTIELFQSQVLAGSYKSCGCLKKEVEVGATKHPLYHLWNGMKARCNYPSHIGYKTYGGRGIKVCDRWMNSFEAFVTDMGPRPSGATLDREDSNKDYEPNNCRWATRREQAENTRRNQYLEANGERLTISQWSRKLGVRQQTLHRRRHRGWTDEAIINTPIGTRT